MQRARPPRRPAAALLACLVALSCAAPTAPTDGAATVRAVVDGDTIRVRYGPHDETVRLLGIDTPETHHPERPVECFGPEAADRLARLLPPGTAIRLRLDVEARDRYGRLLAWVRRVPDDLDVQGTLVDEGLADVLSIEPNRARRAELARRRDAARRAGRGLWSGCAGPHVAAGAPRNGRGSTRSG